MQSLQRAVSPVIGVTLMVTLTVLLAAVFAAGFLTFDGGLEQKTGQFDDELENNGQSGESVTTASANPWSGEAGDLVRVSDNEAGAANVRYRINFTIKPGSDTVGNSLNSVKLDVVTGSPDMFSGTTQSDLSRAVVDEGSDGTEDIDLEGSLNGWNPSNGGSSLKIGFNGSAYSATGGDSIIVIFEGVDNPESAGTYSLEAETSGDGNTHNGTIEIVSP